MLFNAKKRSWKIPISSKISSKFKTKFILHILTPCAWQQPPKNIKCEEGWSDINFRIFLTFHKVTKKMFFKIQTRIAWNKPQKIIQFAFNLSSNITKYIRIGILPVYVGPRLQRFWAVPRNFKCPHRENSKRFKSGNLGDHLTWFLMCP